MSALCKDKYQLILYGFMHNTKQLWFTVPDTIINLCVDYLMIYYPRFYILLSDDDNLHWYGVDLYSQSRIK